MIKISTPRSLFLKKWILTPFLFLTAILFTPLLGFSQERVSGTVIDNAGNPMFDVSVVIKNTSKGTTTDASGNFTISAVPKDVVVISYTGYETKEIKLNHQTRLSVTLNAKA